MYEDPYFKRILRELWMLRHLSSSSSKLAQESNNTEAYKAEGRAVWHLIASFREA